MDRETGELVGRSKAGLMEIAVLIVGGREAEGYAAFGDPALQRMLRTLIATAQR